MKPNNERLRQELLAAEYLEAIETANFAKQEQLWQQAETEPELVELFEQVHADLLEEQQIAEEQQLTIRVAAAVEQHLTSATIVQEPTGPVTFADVANEFFRHTPDRLPPEAHLFNDKLRQMADPLPAELGLTALIAHAEAKYGPAPRVYWKAFREIALKVRMRASSEVEYQLAARRAKKPEEPQ